MIDLWIVAQKYLAPNPENASLADLWAARKAGNRETDRRCLVIIMLLVGSTREQVMVTVDLSDDAIRKIIRAFNLYGVDGLIAKKRPGRTPLISGRTKGGDPRRVRGAGTRPEDLLDRNCFPWPYRRRSTGGVLLRDRAASSAREGLCPESAPAVARQAG